MLLGSSMEEKYRKRVTRCPLIQQDKPTNSTSVVRSVSLFQFGQTTKMINVVVKKREMIPFYFLLKIFPT